MAPASASATPPANVSKPLADTLGYNGQGWGTWSSNEIGPWNLSYKKGLLTVEYVYNLDYMYQQAISFQIYAKTTGSYLLSNKYKGTYATCSSPNQYPPFFWTTYTTDSIHTGMVTLTKLDTVNKISSGTFWFAAATKDTLKTHNNKDSIISVADTINNGFFTLAW